MSGISAGISSCAHLGCFYSVYFSTTTNQLFTSLSEGPKIDIFEGIFETRNAALHARIWKPQIEKTQTWISSDYPTSIQAEHRAEAVSAPKTAAFGWKTTKKPQQYPFKIGKFWWFCALPIPAPSSLLTSIWSTGTEFLLDQLQHFVIFLLREKKN